MNGRIIQPNTNNLFNLYDRIPVNQITTVRNPLKGVWGENILSEVFFSKENISIIQNGIRAGVYQKSGQKYLIDNQDTDQLIVIMRGMFVQYSANLPTEIKQQVEKLNNKVIIYCSNKVFEEAQGYLRYLNDSTTLPPPLEYPSLANTHSRQLEFKGFF